MLEKRSECCASRRSALLANPNNPIAESNMGEALAAADKLELPPFV
jgi:hypothetical protein